MSAVGENQGERGKEKSLGNNEPLHAVAQKTHLMGHLGLNQFADGAQIRST
jgi:hypothetical protein